jgi:very-short-patch-repair endonuclease
MNIKDITPDFLWESGINPEGMRFGPNFYPYNPKLKQFSRDLRNHGQLSEALLWKCLKGKKTGYLFLRQRPILNYIADFFCYELKLVIEIDGASHFSAEAQKRDAERDRQMQAIGLRIVRVLDSDVRKDPEGVVQGIMEQLPPKGGKEVFI